MLKPSGQQTAANAWRRKAPGSAHLWVLNARHRAVAPNQLSQARGGSLPLGVPYAPSIGPVLVGGFDSLALLSAA